MQGRPARLTILALLLVTGLAAAVFLWTSSRAVLRLHDHERAIDARLDRLTAAAAALGAAQQGYVAPGQLRGEWMTRATVAIQELYDEAAALRTAVRADRSADALRAFAEAVDGVVRADDRAREHLRGGQELMAAELLYTESRATLERMSGGLSDLRDFERESAGLERRTHLTRAVVALIATAAIWIGGVLLLARVRAQADESPAAVEPAANEAALHPAPPASVDLVAAADVCRRLTRLSSSTELPQVLERASQVLDASGLIVWMGAGEELFAATAYGYTPRTLARFGPIARGADNATADAWRSAEMRTVTAGLDSAGAIVAPLLRPDGCFGVLSAEVRRGREHDESTRAVAAMIAAQLSAVVAPWPAPSAGDTVTATGEPSSADSEGSRQTAASA